MAQGISLMILGIIAATSLVFSNHPKNIKILNKLVPIQGWIGLGYCFWGIYSLISNNILEIDQAQVKSIHSIAIFLVNIMQIIIAYLLGYTMISQFVFSENEEAKRKGDQRLLEMAPLQGKMGIAGVIIGLASLMVFTYF